MKAKIIFLTDEFFNNYMNIYKEMENKPERPYLHLLIEYQEKKVVIPFRHHISHKYCYPTSPVINGQCQGLDFSKALIIDEKYIDYFANPTISKEEFGIIKSHIKTIHFNFEKYVIKYIKAYNKIQEGKGHKEHLNLCKYSCLQYFHKELGL